MKRTELISCLLCLVFCWGTVTAQNGLSDNQRLLGYTVGDGIDVNGAAFGQAATYNIGASFPASRLAFYAGCKVVGIRVAAACDLGRTPFFLYSDDPEQGMTLLHSQNQKLYEGWNNIFFNGPGYEITGLSDLFFGFGYSETPEMVAGDIGGICAVGPDTRGAFLLYQNGALYEVTGVGMLCIQLIVDVTNLPDRNMAMTYFDPGFRFKQTGEPMEVFTMVQNVGKLPVTSFRMGGRFDNLEPVYADAAARVASGAQETWEHLFPMPTGMEAGKHSFTLWVDEIDGEKVPEGEAKGRKAWFAYYDESCPRKMVYLEEYTDSRNVAGSLFDGIYAGLAETRSDICCRVVMHEPSSALGIDSNSGFFDRYAYTTPCFTVNRAYFPGEQHTAYDLNDYFGVLPDDFLVAILDDIVSQDFNSPSFGNVGVEAEADAVSRHLTVNVSGTVLEDAETICGPLAVTLLLTEDSVQSPQAILTSYGQVKTSSNYVHDDVLRAYITSPHGDALTVSDGNFTIQREYDVPPDWNLGNLRVTALLHAATQPDGSHFEDILDSDRVVLTPGSGVKEINTQDESRQYYTLQGVPLRDVPTSGFYIIRKPETGNRKPVPGTVTYGHRFAM